MKAMVSGAGGFIGSHLCAQLFEQGYEVHALTRYGAEDQDDRMHWWQLDLTDHAETRRIVDAVRPNLFFHLASNVKGARDLEIVHSTFLDNALTTVNILTALAGVGCDRCVLAGSLEEPDLGRGVTVPSSPYAASKATSTLYANMFSDLYDLPITNARIFMVYGPAQRDETKVVPFSIRRFLTGEAPRFGSQRLVDWIYVSDVVAGLIRAATSPAAAGVTVDIGSGSLVQVQEVIREIGRQMDFGRDIAFEPLPERPNEQVRKADVEATRALLEWEPKVTLEEGLGKTIAYYRQHPPLKSEQ